MRSAALLLICLIAYAPLIPDLGLYWDDWPSLWFLHFFGPDIFPRAFAIDRPAQGWLFSLTSLVFGESVIAWHLFGILARWLSGLALAWLLRLTWPKHADQAIWVALLFVVYPGFRQQFIPITYGHQLLVYGAFLVSLALMVLAQRARGRSLRQFAGLSLSALGLAVWSMFALEYFFGLELLRPALLLLSDDTPDQPAAARLKRAALSWLPYAVAAGSFIAWRITHYTPRGTIVIFDRLVADPFGALVNLATTITQDLAAVAVTAWGQTALFLNPSGVKTSVLAAYLAVTAAAAVISLWLLFHEHRRAEAGSTPVNAASDQNDQVSQPAAGPGMHSWPLQATLLGAYALLIAGWPVWVTDLRLELTFPWDRFTLPFMLGSALLTVGLLHLFPISRAARIVLLSLLVGLAAGAQLRYGLNYRQDWTAQKAFFWQLAWRAPGLEPGSLLLFSASPFAYATDNSLSAPLNWIYAPDLNDFHMPFLMFALDARLGTQLPELAPDRLVIQDYRATSFEGSTSQAVVLFYDPPRCLKVIDPDLDVHLPNKPDFIAEALPLSQPELILQAGPAQTGAVEHLFGAEPAHGWCYYFARAELAVQNEDWEQAAGLAAPALASLPQLGREQAAELLPYIHGLAHTGEWDQALALSRQAAQLFPAKMPGVLCEHWRRFEAEIPPGLEQQQAVEAAYRQFQCTDP